MTLLSVAQMNSQNEIEQNFMTIESLIQQSKAKGAELIVFPENFVCLSRGHYPALIVLMVRLLKMVGFEP